MVRKTTFLVINRHHSMGRAKRQTAWFARVFVACGFRNTWRQKYSSGVGGGSGFLRSPFWLLNAQKVRWTSSNRSLTEVEPSVPWMVQQRKGLALDSHPTKSAKSTAFLGSQQKLFGPDNCFHIRFRILPTFTNNIFQFFSSFSVLPHHDVHAW